ncbi:MAG: hypothetical protein NVSMB51_05980 [Solirubrobacteraceae bacterium]
MIAGSRAGCAAVAAALRGASGLPRLTQRGARSGAAASSRLVARGECPALPSPLRGVYRLEEVSAMWQLPSGAFSAVPLVRHALPTAPAPPGVMRAPAGAGLLLDEHGPVTLHPQMRRQNTAVVGTVEQGKSSLLVASIREDLRREGCAVIVLDPKGDAADAAISAVPPGRVCTVLDMAAPECGFNPLAARASPDAVADFVVAALRGLFSEGEVKGSSDRYLRNALIAALASEGAQANLWHVARLLSVGPDGGAARARAAHRLAELPEHAEVAAFMAEELPAQLADARAATTAKLDAPANKLARVINSASVARVLRNDSLRIDFDALIAHSEVLVVRGALGEIGPGNVAVLMQLLVGMLDASLARAQDRVHGSRHAVALKIDEAPLVINESFARTLALKRSAGLETVACWQSDAQWPSELREQLDALFAHRVLFATASALDARAASSLLMAEYADQVRAGDPAAALLASPDVRMHLPRHTAIVSWTTPQGRERPFLARTLPMAVDPAALRGQAARQRQRAGGIPAAALARVDAPSPGSDPESPVQSRPLQALAGEMQLPAALAQSPPEAAQFGQTAHSAAESHSELVLIDSAVTARRLPVPPRAIGWSFDAQELEVLAWLCAARCALTSQLHRRFNPGRALTTTQRRLKRLADAGLVARYQLHRADGGRISLCCAPTAAAFAALGASGHAGDRAAERTLAELQADVHVVGWLLAFEAGVQGALRSVLGPGRARINPGVRTAEEIVLGDRTHLRNLWGDGAGPMEVFRPLAPDAVAEVNCVDGCTCDLMIVREPREAEAMVRRYDQLISAWWRSVPRYARQGRPPRIVVLCADARRATSLADAAGQWIGSCVARLGVAPEDWRYPGRENIGFADEGEIHRGSLGCWRTSAQPGGAARRDALIEPDSAKSGKAVWS